MDLHTPRIQDDGDIRPGDHSFLRRPELVEELRGQKDFQQPSTAGFYSDGEGGATLTIVHNGQLARIPRTKDQLIGMAAAALELASRMK